MGKSKYHENAYRPHHDRGLINLLFSAATGGMDKDSGSYGIHKAYANNGNPKGQNQPNGMEFASTPAKLAVVVTYLVSGVILYFIIKQIWSHELIPLLVKVALSLFSIAAMYMVCLHFLYILVVGVLFMTVGWFLIPLMGGYGAEERRMNNYRKYLDAKDAKDKKKKKKKTRDMAGYKEHGEYREYEKQGEHEESQALHSLERKVSDNGKTIDGINSNMIDIKGCVQEIKIDQKSNFFKINNKLEDQRKSVDGLKKKTKKHTKEILKLNKRTLTYGFFILAIAILSGREILPSLFDSIANLLRMI